MEVKRQIREVFEELAAALETGQMLEKIPVGITLAGSELGLEVVLEAAESFAKENPGAKVVAIGPQVDTFLTLELAETEEAQARKMEELLTSGEIKACVSMHYNFPLGTATVGRIVTPAMGKSVYLATTTGTASAQRVPAMVLGTIAGIIAAKAGGNEKPTVGILNVDGARAVERKLKELQEGGYDIHFSESGRADGGAVMRGNDLLQGAADILVTDSLTGNLLQKTFSAFQSGGGYESVGEGYGPGIGMDQEMLVFIVSRVSGIPVIKGALAYALRLVQGNWRDVAKAEYAAAKKAGLEKLLEASEPKAAQTEEVTAPPEEVVTSDVSGIDILELEEAVQVLWKEGIYACSGMGCTGPVIQVSDANSQKAKDILEKAGYLG